MQAYVKFEIEHIMKIDFLTLLNESNCIKNTETQEIIITSPLIEAEGDYQILWPIKISSSSKYMTQTIHRFWSIDYEDYPRGISLKSCFRSPAFIALTFKTLSTNYLTQVWVSMFISFVKNGEKISPDSFNTQNPISIKASNL